MIITEQGKKIIFVDGKDRYVTNDKKRAISIFSKWIYGERLPEPQLK